MVTPSIVAVVATEVTEPLSVMLPDVVTEPDSDRPFADPVPLTEVTVPTETEPPSEMAEPLMVIDELVRALLAIPESVPPSVRLPEVVTLPDKVSPLTVPVPPTEVTVPVFDV